MNTLNFHVPEEHTAMLTDLLKTPFAKMDDGYRFASWIYALEDSDVKRDQLLETENGDTAAKLLEAAKAALEAVLITEDDYLNWTIHKKESGGVAQYHKIINDLAVNILMLAINMPVETIAEASHKTEKAMYGIFDSSESSTKRCVLNRNNPFSDVMIKSQQFFYKTADNTAETLFFNTNNIVEKVDKNGQNMLTMRPSFSVIKEHGVAQKPMQSVTFGSSIAEPIAGDEDHIYIHID